MMPGVASGEAEVFCSSSSSCCDLKCSWQSSVVLGASVASGGSGGFHLRCGLGSGDEEKRDHGG